MLRTHKATCTHPGTAAAGGGGALCHWSLYVLKIVLLKPLGFRAAFILSHGRTHTRTQTLLRMHAYMHARTHADARTHVRTQTLARTHKRKHAH